MGKYLLVVESNCKNTAREKEFNDWYNQIHIPDIMSTGYIDKATRYELTTAPPEGRGRYLAVYEIESDNIDATMSEFRAKMDVIAEGRMCDLLKVTSRGIYRKTTSFTK